MKHVLAAAKKSLKPHNSKFLRINTVTSPLRSSLVFKRDEREEIRIDIFGKVAISR